MFYNRNLYLLSHCEDDNPSVSFSPACPGMESSRRLLVRRQVSTPSHLHYHIHGPFFSHSHVKHQPHTLHVIPLRMRSIFHHILDLMEKRFSRIGIVFVLDSSFSIVSCLFSLSALSIPLLQEARSGNLFIHITLAHNMDFPYQLPFISPPYLTNRQSSVEERVLRGKYTHTHTNTQKSVS
jgi:hypothetical protein